MREIATVVELRETLTEARRAGRSVGFVPTMGYLHAGHLSLMERAAQECDLALASVFVNPLQFAVGEDLDTYPRDLDRDRQLAAGAGIDLLFAPPVAEMYPESVATTVSVSGLSAVLEGASRPTHFAGVATVVAKLFNLSGPCRAYFGEKDFQQIAVIRRMVRDLSVPVEVVACPTFREADGLAMSSRNAYLDPAGRAAAPVLYQALVAGVEQIQRGANDADAVRAAMRAVVESETLAELDYLEVADPDSLEPLGELSAWRGSTVRLLGAIRIGTTRLIDNVGAIVPQETTP
jgi:pantoate--beta-alanine ligase